MNARFALSLALSTLILFAAGCSSTGVGDGLGHRDAALRSPVSAALERSAAGSGFSTRAALESGGHEPASGLYGAFRRPRTPAASAAPWRDIDSAAGFGRGNGAVRSVNNITGFAALWDSPSIQFAGAVYLIAGLPSGLALLPFTAWFGMDAIMMGFFPTGALPAIILGGPAILIEAAIRHLA